MLKKAFIAFGIIIVVFFIIVAMKPDNFRITRSMLMAAPASAIFGHINNLHNWNVWSPWAKLDPNSKATYSGPVEGVGASFKWEGNDKVGVGTMTIVESRLNEYVKFNLEFIKPFAATNAAKFTLRPQGNGTLVTWSMSGTNNFMGKLMSVIMDCDKMVGGQFEKGLTDLKAIVEKK